MAINNKKSGLGKGMGSLFNKNMKAVVEHKDDATANNENVVLLDLKVIRPNPFQPRQRFDQDKLEDLARSIKQSGVLSPIVVRQNGQEYEIIAGERRVRASRLAKQENIPAIVRSLEDADMMEMAIIENLQRDDLDAIEEAQAFQALMTQLNYTQAQVAEKIGKDRSAVANAVRLLKLPVLVQDFVQEGQLTMGHARALLGLKKKSQIEPAANEIIKRGFNVRQVEAMVNQLNTEPKTVTSKVPSPFTVALTSELEEKFGTKVKVDAHNNGKGKIEIAYMSHDDLNRILDVLNIDIN